MAQLPSPRPSRSDFSGPLRNFLSVRSGGWLRRFEEWMLEVAAAQDLEETLSDVEASVGDLISAKEFEEMAAITFEFGQSTVRTEDIADMVEARFFKEGRAEAPPAGQTVPAPEEGYAVVFRDFFTCGLRMPPYHFLREVMESFNVELQHFSPNGILTLSKFAWACESYGAMPHIDTFCSYFELQRQPKKVKDAEGVECIAQFGSCAFMPRRTMPGPRCEISYCQKGKWEKDWMRAWFYVKTPAASKTLDDGSVDKVYPYASLMKELKPFSKVDPSQEMSEERLACDKAFALACRYSGGRDLVEEMVAADYWPLGRRTDEFTIEMVQVPVFGPPEGLPFPRFGAGIPEDETKESFLDRVEVSARRIVGKISEKEYLQRRSALGTMPRFNRVFEELGIEYEDYVIPPDVLLGLEKKDSSKAVALAESKKRKGGGAVKQLAKKRRAEVVLETPVESSSARSSGAESNSVASAPAEAAAAGGAPEVEASRAVSSVRAPFASLLGEESSDAEAPEASPAREANPAASEGPRVASVGGGSPPKEVQVESSDEAESASVRRIRRAEAPLRPAGDGINSLYMGNDFLLIICFSASFD